MQKSIQPSSKEGFGIQDVLYILFKHKWKITIFSLLGVSAAAVVYMKRQPLYQSEAWIMIDYVLNRNTVEPTQSFITTPGSPGDQAINNEVDILRSEITALNTVDAVGIEKVLPQAAGNATREDAVSELRGKSEVLVTPMNNVIKVNYGSSNPKLAVEVLKAYVEQYFIMHKQIHRSVEVFAEVEKETIQIYNRMKETEADLAKLKTDTGIISLAAVSSELSAQRSRAKEEKMTAEVELAEQRANVHTLEGAVATLGPIADETPKPAGQQAPVQAVTQYKAWLDMLSILQKRDIELRLKYKPGNQLISINQQQITDYEVKRRDLLNKYPSLTSEAAVVGQNSKNPQSDIIGERGRLASLTAKVKMYDTLLGKIQQVFTEQYPIGERIDELERRRQMEETEYRSKKETLEQLRLDMKMDPSRMPNAKIIQPPSIPIKTYDKITQKIVLGLAGGGIALGVGLAFLIELLIDRRVKRPTEIQARLQLPLLLSIPYIRRKERGEMLLVGETVPKIGQGLGALVPSVSSMDDPEQAIRKASHFIFPYSETIRDRIIFNFEVNNVTHKPKLVAVTGLSEGAGSSTIAAGLAKSFSEINGAKVLLVDLNSQQSRDGLKLGDAARHSLNGALQLARNSSFKQSSQRLYYASAAARRDDSGLTTFSPMHLYELMPHLQASEFDYIVFDMPTIDQTSRTLTMAGLMDKVLLVLDAENTSRDALKWGYSELVKGRADVSCIFNKTRSHAPEWMLGKS